MNVDVSAREVDTFAVLYSQCTDFLYREAQHLDHHRFKEWLELLAEDLVYEMPVRMTLGPEAGDREFSHEAFHMKETYASMKMRVSRHYSGHAYAEDPPSRTQRFVTNVLVSPKGHTEADVTSNFLIYRSAGDLTDHHLIAGERIDVLRETDAGWKLARRVVRLAHTTLVPPNFALFL